MDRVFLTWLLILGLGFPLLWVLLNEAADRLDTPQPQLAIALRKIARYVLPPLAAFLIMGHLLEVDEAHEAYNASRLVETLAALALIVTGIPLINAVFTTERAQGFQIKVPNLFFQVVRAAVVIGLGYRILGGIWHVDLGGLATAAGVGSLVIALALQDTLSNLVSGFLMLLSRPFKEGDYIEFEDVKGYVVDQDWRSVTLRDRALEKTITVPNGTLSQATIDNFGNLQADGKWHHITCHFSYDDPPFRVLGLLSTLGNGLEHELTHPQVYPVIDGYGESSITYKVWYKKSPGSSKRHPDSRKKSVSTILYSRLYYLAQREHLKIPYPISMSYDVEASDGMPSHIPQKPQQPQAQITEFLTNLPYFTSLSAAELNRLANVSAIADYGLGEVIVREGAPDQGLYVIYSGSIWSSTQDYQGEAHDLAQLGPGELFGEMSLFPGEVSPITVIARQDTQLMVLPTEAVRQLIQGDAHATGNPQFATEILAFIDERKRKLHFVKAPEEPLNVI